MSSTELTSATASKPPGSSSGSWSERVWFTLSALLLSVFAWALNLTVRYRFEDREAFESSLRRDRPVILSLWHNQIFLAIYVLRFRSIAVMTSLHRDGEYIAGVIRSFGHLPVRGSSSQRPVAALLELKKCLQEGYVVAFTIDGPRGPRYKVKGGPLVLAAKTQIPILPFHIEPQRYWEMKSWDRFRIPKPFTRALVKMGSPLQIPAGCDREVWIKKYQTEMDRIQEHCRDRVAAWG